jgi:ATP-dependent Clp protease ATP-binding subunit ClpA
MNLSNFTIKAAEAIQQAQQIAFNHSNTNIETEHILKALLDQQDSPVEYLLKKNAVNIQQLEARLDQQTEKLPRMSGGTFSNLRPGLTSKQKNFRGCPVVNLPRILAGKLIMSYCAQELI